MKNPISVRVLGALVLSAGLLAGCWDSAETSEGRTTDGEVTKFVQACLAQSNMDRPLCECIAQSAREELTPGGFEMLLASIEDDDARAMQLRSQLSVEEMTQSGMFMVSAPGRCAAGG